MSAPALEGFALGLSLIVAIGAQNAFVLRQGLARQHVLAIVTVCAAADAVLIGAGVAGLGGLVSAMPRLLTAITLAGAAFLAFYAALALRRALKPHALTADGAAVDSLSKALAMTLAFTFLNPHVYLDTVVLFGGLSARYPGIDRAAFATGGIAGSIVWFFGLGFGARLLAPVFARPLAWRILDASIAIVMALLAISLVSRLT